MSTESKVKQILFDHDEINRASAWAIACEHYSAKDLLEVKSELKLNDDDFIEMVKFIEERGGLEEKRVGDNSKPVDVERTDGRGHSDPDEVEEGLDDA